MLPEAPPTTYACSDLKLQIHLSLSLDKTYKYHGYQISHLDIDVLPYTSLFIPRLHGLHRIIAHKHVTYTSHLHLPPTSHITRADIVHMSFTYPLHISLSFIDIRKYWHHNDIAYHLADQLPWPKNIHGPEASAASGWSVIDCENVGAIF